MTSKTPNLNLNLPNFNTSPWHDELNNNFRAIDAVIKSIFGLTTLLGPYKNSTAVSAGQRYFDENSGFYYEALSDFTTAPFPNTFAEERIAYPARWDLLDASAALDAAANALASELAASASQVVAQASAASATTSASAAAVSASNAATSAANASTSATSASTAATSANASATSANASAALVLEAANNAGALLPETIAANTTGNAATATNATQLGGIISSNYARTDINELFSGLVEIARLSTDEQLAIGRGRVGNPLIALYNDTVQKGLIRIFSNFMRMTVRGTGIDYNLELVDDGRLLWRGQSVWYAGSDIRHRAYTTATRPSPSVAGAGTVIYLTDAVGGATLAFSDGAAWRNIAIQ